MTTSNILMTNSHGESVWVTRSQKAVIETGCKAVAGGFGRVKNYVVKSNVEATGLESFTMITRVNTGRTYARKASALRAIPVADLLDRSLIAKFDIEGHADTMSDAEIETAMNDRLAYEISRLERDTDAPTNAHHDAHKRNYCRFANGVKVNYVTERVRVEIDGKKVYRQLPVLDSDGIPTAAGIQFSAFIIDREVHTAPVYKTAKKRSFPVVCGNAINSLLNQRSVGFKTITLKDDNFESFKVAKNVIVPPEMADLIF